MAKEKELIHTVTGAVEKKYREVPYAFYVPANL
jgi:hypothetical protein